MCRRPDGRTQPVAANHRTILHDHPIAELDALANRHTRVNDAVVANLRAGSDDDAGEDHRSRAPMRAPEPMTDSSPSRPAHRARRPPRRRPTRNAWSRQRGLEEQTERLGKCEIRTVALDQCRSALFRRRAGRDQHGRRFVVSRKPWYLGLAINDRSPGPACSIPLT